MGFYCVDGLFVLFFIVGLGLEVGWCFIFSLGYSLVGGWGCGFDLLMLFSLFGCGF